jgi:cytochrome b561
MMGYAPTARIRWRNFNMSQEPMDAIEQMNRETYKAGIVVITFLLFLLGVVSFIVSKKLNWW